MKLSHKRLQDLEELEDNIGYKFNNKELLNFAFIHSSYSNENKDYENKNNERLEFLGDVVVSLIVSRELFLLFKDVPEGDLTRMRSQIVCEKSFSEAAIDLNLGKYLLLSKGEENTGGRTRESILADTFEAFCGAVFLDSDFNNISEFLINRFKNIVTDKILNNGLFIDYKTKLQELYHKSTGGKIRYHLDNEIGPDHEKTFYISAMEGNKALGKGFGKNKKIAEQKAAKDALLKMGVLDE